MDYIAFYNKGIEEKQNGNFELSATYHIRALELSPLWDLPEAWHNAGAALLRIQKSTKAKPYLKKALAYYQENIDLEEKIAYNLFWMACVYALLRDKENMLKTLKNTLVLDEAYAEEALYEEDFKAYSKDPDFLALINPLIEKLEKSRYRGEALNFEDLSDDDARNIECFRIACESNKLGEDKMADMLKANVKISPQSMFEHCENPIYCIRLSLHVDTKLLFLELSHRQHNYDNKAFRLYLPADNTEVALANIVQNVAHHAPKIDEQNWPNLIKPLAVYCKELLYEMSDGSKIKLN
jgi:tetratricopeptide (TPR) repeat protein